MNSGDTILILQFPATRYGVRSEDRGQTPEVSGQRTAIAICGTSICNSVTHSNVESVNIVIIVEIVGIGADAFYVPIVAFSSR